MKLTTVSFYPKKKLGSTGNLETGYLIEDFLPEHHLKLLASFWTQRSSIGVDWDRTVYHFKGRAHMMANQRTFADLYDRKIFDLHEHPEWEYQTPETIVEWSKARLLRLADPILLNIADQLKTLEPFQPDPDNWIMSRALINVLAYGKILDQHKDSSPQYYNCKMADSKQYSVTIYLNEVSDGGEFWTYSDPSFVYKPKPNSAFIFNGGATLHGVSMNLDKDKQTRKAVTLRFVHTDTLYLPGHPDKFLIRNPSMQEIIQQRYS